MYLPPRGLEEIRSHQRKRNHQPLWQIICGVVNVAYLTHRMNHADIQMYQNPCGVQLVEVDRMTM